MRQEQVPGKASGQKEPESAEGGFFGWLRRLFGRK